MSRVVGNHQRNQRPKLMAEIPQEVVSLFACFSGTIVFSTLQFSSNPYTASRLSIILYAVRMLYSVLLTTTRGTRSSMAFACSPVPERPQPGIHFRHYTNPAQSHHTGRVLATSTQQPNYSKGTETLRTALYG